MEFEAIVLFVAAGVAMVVGVSAVLCERGLVAGGLFLLGMFLVALDGLLAGVGAGALLPEQVVRLHEARLCATAMVPVVWLSFSLVFARGNRRESLRRWGYILAAFVVVPALAVTTGYGSLIVSCQAPAPGHSEYLVRLGWAGKTLHLMALLAGVAVLMNLERTYRSAVGTMRWRIKFIILGVGTLFAVRIHTSSQALLYSSVYAAGDLLNAAATLLGGLLIVKGLLRNREGRVDLYVSHSVLYQSATVMLSGAYLLFIGVLAGVLGRFGVVAGFPVLALVVFAGIVGLGVMLSSDRLRINIHRFVREHFRRPQFDYRRVWMRFAEATAGVMDREPYCRSVVRMVSETFDALSVTIWVTNPGGDRLVFGASTSLSAGAVATEPEGSGLMSALLRGLSTTQKPFDIELSAETWVVALRDCNPVSFPDKGGHRIAAPLVRQEALIGVMVVGDRVSGVPFSTEEMDLIGVIAEQVAGGLLNMNLSERLMGVRELDAFRTMSAFFVHDLKNTASTLSLMLENMPKHFEDPLFQADALKSIGKSVNRMEQLIHRLTLLRSTLDIHPAQTDINALVRDTVAGLADALIPRPVIELGTVHALRLDREHMEKVLTNLLLNARDAAGPTGQIRLCTRMDGDAVLVEVTDNGCGMSRRFIDESLFRPFRSTKKEGMGIGLFQSKMIVEAHGGKIEVTSEENRGSTFRVRLPLEGKIA